MKHSSLLVLWKAGDNPSQEQMTDGSPCARKRTYNIVARSYALHINQMGTWERCRLACKRGMIVCCRVRLQASLPSPAVFQDFGNTVRAILVSLDKHRWHWFRLVVLYFSCQGLLFVDTVTYLVAFMCAHARHCSSSVPATGRLAQYDTGLYSAVISPQDFECSCSSAECTPEAGARRVPGHVCPDSGRRNMRSSRLVFCAPA